MTDDALKILATAWFIMLFVFLVEELLVRVARFLRRK